MGKRQPKSKRPLPSVTITHHDATPPQYSPAELEGLKTEAARIAQHINILEEEVKNKRAQLIGLEKLILDNSPS